MINEEKVESFTWDDEDILIGTTEEEKSTKTVEKSTAKTATDKEDQEDKEPDKKTKGDEDSFSFEDPEDSVVEELEIIKELGLEVDSLEDVFEAFESKIDERAKEYIENIFEELDEDAIAFIKFKKAGGATQDFLKALSNVEVSNLSPDKDKEAETIIRMQLQSEGMDEDEITDRLEYLEDKGTKSSQAKKYKEKMLAQAEKLKSQLVKEAEDEEAERQEQAKKYKENLISTVDKVKEVSGLVIPDKEKKGLKDFLTKPTEKAGKVYVTPFQKKLNEVVRDSEKLVLLAYLLKTDFNLDNIKTQVRTQEIKGLKDKLSRTERVIKNTSKVSLADFF